ncbi:hypothetical protein ABPG75_010404 [Micractinium tetrahymenae]
MWVGARELLQATPNICTPISSVKPTIVPKVCPPNSVAATPVTGQPPKCALKKCPPGYAFNETSLQCEFKQCPKPTIYRADRDGDDNGIRCCYCPDRAFPSFLAVNGQLLCYSKCNDTTENQIASPVPKCCSKACPDGFPVSASQEQCRTATWPFFFADRSCTLRKSASPTCVDLKPTVDPPMVDPICPRNSVNVTDASSGAVTCLPATSAPLAHPPRTPAATPCCYSSADADLVAVLALLRPEKCKSFLSNFAKCIDVCPTTTVTPVRT